MDEAKKQDNRPEVQKVGVAWLRKTKNGKEAIKISINHEIFIAHKNLKKSRDLDPDFVVVRYVDSPKKEEK
jgi:hypothetical protein